MTHNKMKDWMYTENYADLLGSPCDADEAIELLIDHDEIIFEVDVQEM